MAILSDQSIQYAYDRPQYYRNSYRESTLGWGTPVYFVPPGNYSGNGNGGPKYQYGYTYNNSPSSYLGNCTWWCYGRCLEANDSAPAISDWTAKNWYSTFSGSKDAGNFGSKIQVGDIIVFTDSGDGHVVFVESIEGNTIHISESAYSTKSVYSGKACIVYTLNASDLYEGHTISLRPQSPFSETCVGVIHTGRGGPTPVPPPDPVSYQIINFNQTAYITDSITGKLNDTSLAKKYFMRDNSESSYVEFTPTISGDTFSYPLGNSFEAKIPNSNSGIVYIKVEAHDNWNDPAGKYSGDYIKWIQEVPITYEVPDTYRPSISYSNLKKNNLYNNNLIAGYSNISVDYSVKSSAPTGYNNSAIIENKTEFKAYVGDISVSGDKTSGTISLTTTKEKSNYSVYITGSATDSRNRTTSGVETDHLLVYKYSTPSVIFNSTFKCDKDGNYDISGSYLKSNFDIDLSLVDLGNNIKVEDIYVNINERSYEGEVYQNEDGSYEFLIGDLDPSLEYSPTLTLHDDVMSNFGIDPITTAGMAASKIPFSLLDDEENNVGAAFGMEAVQRNAVEFAPSIQLKATNMSTGETIMKPAYEVLANESKISILDFYPIGSLYLSTNSINPSELFGGEWQQIKDTFLLAAGDKHAGGSTGGSETTSHTLTIDEMPAHTHQYKVDSNGEEETGRDGEQHSVPHNSVNTRTTESTGGGLPFTINTMPPYLSVYVFERIK